MNKLYSSAFGRAHHGFKQRGLSKVKPRESANNSVLSKLKRTHNANNVCFQRKKVAYFSGKFFTLRHVKKLLNGCFLVFKAMFMCDGRLPFHDVTITTTHYLLRSAGEAESLQLSPMKQIQNDEDASGGMASTAQSYPRVPRKKTLEQQAVVDEILQVVADQGRRLSLSQTDYSVQKRIEFGLRRQKRLTSEGSSFDDSSSCASGSDLSTSPPPSRHSSISSFSDDGKMFEFSSRPRTLPPLNRSRTHRPFRPTPPKIDFDEEREMNCASRLSRPMSARGQRSRPQRGFTL